MCPLRLNPTQACPMVNVRELLAGDLFTKRWLINCFEFPKIPSWGHSLPCQYVKKKSLR